MDKKITKLSAGRHFSIDLSDQSLSVFIDGDSGVIFLDEGPGPDRVNGAALIPDRRARFVLRGGSSPELLLQIEYCGRVFTAGTTDTYTLVCQDEPTARPIDSVERWVESVNQALFRRGPDGLKDVPQFSGYAPEKAFMPNLSCGPLDGGMIILFLQIKVPGLNSVRGS